MALEEETKTVLGATEHTSGRDAGRYVGLLIVGFLLGSGRWRQITIHGARIGSALGEIALDRVRSDLRDLPWTGERASAR